MARAKRKRKYVTWQNVKIALPKGATSLTPAMKATIDAEYSDRRWSAAKGKACRGIFWGRNNFVLRCDKNRSKKSTTAGRCVQWAAGQYGERCLKRAGASKKPGGRAIPGRRTTRGGEILKAGGLTKAAKRRFSRGELCLRKGKISTSC
jgi:hypothetical protein